MALLHIMLYSALLISVVWYVRVRDSIDKNLIMNDGL